jgi:hypothetical protein
LAQAEALPKAEDGARPLWDLQIYQHVGHPRCQQFLS